MSGKGDSYRKVDQQKWEDNYNYIFRKDKTMIIKTVKELSGKTFNNTTITLIKDAVYDFTDLPPCVLGKNVTITGNKATIKDRTQSYHSPFNFGKDTSKIVFKDIKWDLKVKNILEPHGDDIKWLNNIIVKGSNGIATGKGVSNVLVDGLIDEGQFSGNAFGFFAGAGVFKGKWNENLTFKNINIKYGSSGEHILRFHNTKNLIVRDSFLDNSKSPVGKHALNIRDGQDFLIENVTNNAPLPIGGLEIPGEEDKTLKNVVLKNCKINGWIAVYSGVSGLIFDKCSGTATKGSYTFSFRKPFGNRKQGSGVCKDCSWVYKGGKFIAGKGLQTVNTTFNGKLV